MTTPCHTIESAHVKNAKVYDYRLIPGPDIGLPFFTKKYTAACQRVGLPTIPPFLPPASGLNRANYICAGGLGDHT